MTNVIIYKKPDGTAAIGIPTPECGDLDIHALDILAPKTQPNGDIVWDLPEGTTHRITDSANIPSDREYRNEWTDDNVGDTVDVDMVNAKITQMDRIRTARDAQWGGFDKRYNAAQRDASDLTALDAERQALKDMPNDCETPCTDATTPAELSAVWPVDLPRV